MNNVPTPFIMPKYTLLSSPSANLKYHKNLPNPPFDTKTKATPMKPFITFKIHPPLFTIFTPMTCVQ